MATAARAFRGIRGATIRREIVARRLLGLADRYEAQFRNVIRSAIRMGQRVTLEKLAAAIRTGNEQAILAAIPWDDRALPALRATLPSLAADLARQSARLNEELLPGNVQYRFDITNPLSIRQALDHSNQLVTEIGESTREGLRKAIAEAIQEGRPPLQAARDIRNSVGLRSDQLERLANMRAKGAQGTEIARARERMLQERTLLIARTETLWSANEGQRALWEQGRQAGIIPASAQREFITTPDDRLCAICEPLDGKLYGIEQQITTELGSVDSPPIHPNCRCTMSLVIQ